MTEEQITDEALDAAAAEVAADEIVPSDEEVVEEIQEEVETPAEEMVTDGEEEIPTEPLDHGERSQLGRKHAETRQMVEEQNARLDRMMDVMERMQTPQTQQPIQPPFDPDEEIPMTWGEMERKLEAREQLKQQAAEQDATRYESGYREQFSQLVRDFEPDEAKAIETEMLANYNVRYSNDPTLDAERNFLKAENAVLRNRPPAKPNVNLRGATPKGGPSSTQTASRAAVPVKLDPIAAEFVQKTGMSEEDVAKVLAGEMPLNLVQGNINA